MEIELQITKVILINFLNDGFFLYLLDVLRSDTLHANNYYRIYTDTFFWHTQKLGVMVFVSWLLQGHSLFKKEDLEISSYFY